ncbi:MAG: adenosine deaminase [Gemmatimonadales bacterium]|nr:MAG: adenosine deaminase [Gemmatimonadales bacterium]
MSVSHAFLHALPKAELHVHLDGSLRPTTMLELAESAGVSMPASRPRELAEWMRADDTPDLESYLARFATTLSVMQTAESLERITRELVEDHAAENVEWLEIRYSPILNMEGGLTMEEAVEAPLRGFQAASEATGVKGGLILCGIRNMDPATSLEIARTAVRYRDQGVLAFDLAGAEAGNPPNRHQSAFDEAVAGNLPVTIHAGEAWGPESIHQALHQCRARRIGHGARLLEDPELLRWVRDQRVPLEICLTSNVQTGAAATAAEHPVRSYFDQGILLTLCTDNRLVSGVDLVHEYASAARDLGFGRDELVQVARMGFEAGFAPWPLKQELLAGFDARVDQLPD